MILGSDRHKESCTLPVEEQYQDCVKRANVRESLICNYFAITFQKTSFIDFLEKNKTFRERIVKMQSNTGTDVILLLLLLAFTRLGQCIHRIDIIQLICGANKVTGFYHSVKSIRTSSYVPCFPTFGLNISPHSVFGLNTERCSVQMRENTDQKNSEYRHFIHKIEKLSLNELLLLLI